MEARGTAEEGGGGVTPWAGRALGWRSGWGPPPRCRPSSPVLAGLSWEPYQDPGSESESGLASGRRRGRDAEGCSCAERRARCTAAHGAGCSAGTGRFQESEGTETCPREERSLDRQVLPVHQAPLQDRVHKPWPVSCVRCGSARENIRWRSRCSELEGTSCCMCTGDFLCMASSPAHPLTTPLPTSTFASSRRYSAGFDKIGRAHV